MPTNPDSRSFGTQDLAEFDARLVELRNELVVPSLAGDYVAYTDGACLGNPRGPGGWAAVMHEAGGTSNWLWGHLSSTSNNRAEALGVLAALEWLPAGSRLALHSDSELTVRVLQGQYKAKANPDIWHAIRRCMADKSLTLNAAWVRGHAGDPGNELADRLSRLGATRGSSLAELPDQAPMTRAPSARSKAAAPELVGLKPQGDWERDFLKSVGKQLQAGRALSPKQQAVVDRIRSRADLEPPPSSTASASA